MRDRRRNFKEDALLKSAVDFPGELTIRYDDDPDQEQAGQGLQSFPLMNAALRTRTLEYWMMSPSEQVAMVFLLEHLRPKVAIEIGTRFGGSLQALAQFCDRVYSIDIDPDVPKRLAGKFPNVEYLTGLSDDLLPPLINRLQRERAELSFALIDGDHSTNGVRKDVDNVLRFRPVVPLYIVMHDSLNPACRAGLREAQWAANPFVHAVELDFVAGIVNPAPACRGIWGGLAVGIALPYERSGRFQITARSELTLQSVLEQQKRTFLRRAAAKVKQTLLGAH
jgi:hypothetical protein